MKRTFARCCCLALISVLILSDAVAQQTQTPHAAKRDWWNIKGIKAYELPKSAQKMSMIRVEGNSFRDGNGQQIIFRGLSISDPDKLVKEGRWNKKHFEVIKSWGANLVRIPVHPISVHQRGLENYIRILDEAVTWSSELGLYLIIDWHSIGNLKTEVLANENYDTTIKETFNFWRTISAHYKNVPAVAFYELFNEPTIFNGQYGHCSWYEWKSLMEQLIDVVYAHDQRVIPLVAGFNWAYDLTPVKDNPISREGIAYVTHPYPGKRAQPREPQWENDFGFVADKYPVIATEIGFMDDTDDDNLRNDGLYGPSIINYFNKKGISWTAWVFDPYWEPQMIRNWDYEATESGKFFREAMKAGNPAVKE